ncbi:MAG: P-type DNA transfer ATPase VirB11 [Rickettsia sp.]|nr:P-type DNA transfer ATPase VirB11 [Rickettsia sp.]
MSNSIKALETYLIPFNAVFAEEGINEITINRPQEVWIEKGGELKVESYPELTFSHLISLGQLIAQFTSQKLSEEYPLLSATLPNGYRIQIIFPPACGANSVAMSIRKTSTELQNMEKYILDSTKSNKSKKNYTLDDDTKILKEYLEHDKILEFLKHGIKCKKNFIISGGTSTGKTSFANSLLAEIPIKERLITVEDAREIILQNHNNKLHLITSKGGQGVSQIDTQDLIEASLRLRPDRIILGELRGKEAFSFLRAINTGHPGSVATVHADSPNMAIEQLKLMVMQAGLSISNEEIDQYIKKIVNVIIQLKRSDKGQRYVSEVFFNE